MAPSDRAAVVRAQRVTITSLVVAALAIGVAVWQASTRTVETLEPAQFVVPLRDSVPLVLGAVQPMGGTPLGGTPLQHSS